jgi:hypothetical protein
MANSGYNKFLATSPGMGPVPAVPAVRGGNVRTRRMRGRRPAVIARNKPNRASGASQQVGGGGGGPGR